MHDLRAIIPCSTVVVAVVRQTPDCEEHTCLEIGSDAVMEASEPNRPASVSLRAGRLRWKQTPPAVPWLPFLTTFQERPDLI